jgi:hypothetical protein
MFNLDIRKKVLLEKLGPNLDSSLILEVGFGTGLKIGELLAGKTIRFEIDEIHMGFDNDIFVDVDTINLPFADNIFDIVICNDVLEYLDFKKRNFLIGECIRVAAQKCIICSPHGEFSEIGDINLRNSFEKISQSIKSTIARQSDQSLPKVSETLNAIFNCGYTPSITIDKTALQYYCSLLMDNLSLGSINYYQIMSTKNGIATIESSDGDLPYSIFFCIDKNKILKRVIDIFLNKKSCNTDFNTLNSEISIFSIYHDSAYAAFSKTYGNNKLFKTINPFFVNGGYDTSFNRVLEPIGFFETCNDRCSELTAIHYIWRTKQFSHIVGICHYRRYLYLFPNDLLENKLEQFQININIKDLESMLNKIEDCDQINLLLSQYDILTSIPRELDQTIENHYNLNHFSSDYYKCIEIILEHYPYLEPSTIESMNSRQLYTSNILITKSDIFDNICEVWFDILDKYRIEINIENRNNYQTRDVAFLSERVFDIIIRHLKSVNYKILELPILHINF